MLDDNSVRQAKEDRLEEVDYAILKAIACDIKTNKEITKALKIRNIIVDRQLYKLIKEGSIKYLQYAVLTSRGSDRIRDFEINRPENVWRPIHEYIVSVKEHDMELKQKRIKLIDKFLLVFMAILIILIIYFIIYY
ncbi:MAG: hypothetical protein FIB07_10200 [Candidatus Methanoperedens sp.]|nr:hypothetical protein [Candidatus Methanoperedens sp.]